MLLFTLRRIVNVYSVTIRNRDFRPKHNILLLCVGIHTKAYHILYRRGGVFLLYMKINE